MPDRPGVGDMAGAPTLAHCRGHGGRAGSSAGHAEVPERRVASPSCNGATLAAGTARITLDADDGIGSRAERLCSATIDGRTVHGDAPLGRLLAARAPIRAERPAVPTKRHNSTSFSVPAPPGP